MKTFIVAILCCAIGSAFGVVFGLLTANQQSDTVVVRSVNAVNVDDFKLTTERMTNDMLGRVVAIPPLGQLWAFTPDQKLNITVLQKRGTDEGVVVAVKLGATASVQPQNPPQGPKVEKPAQPSSPPAPVTVQLDGVAKLHYELIAGEWYLLDVTSVNLRATQK